MLCKQSYPFDIFKINYRYGVYASLFKLRHRQ